MHFTATETVRDIVIGMADGLTSRSRWRPVWPGRCHRRRWSWSP
jgi:hypothetical protein